MTVVAKYGLHLAAPRTGLAAWFFRIGAPQTEPRNALLDPHAESTARRFRPWVLLFLLCLCLMPRVWMVRCLPAVCPDAVVYFRAASALEKGDLRAAFADMRLNSLPLALAGMHRLGWDYERGGALWGVLLSTAAVLPLFGWLRRQFDDRVAIVACILYAVHPGLIERSPEVIREPTFWFVFLLGVYASWRAAAEGRLGMYLLAGSCLVAALLTRTEGILLLIPLVGWSLLALLRGGRGYRPIVGLACALAVGPALGVTAYALWGSKVDVASLVRLDPLARVQAWVNSWTAADPSKLMLNDPDGRQIPSGYWGHVREYVRFVGRGIEPVMALLLISCAIGWTRLWTRRDIIPLLAVAGCVLLATWIHLWFANESSSRYVLTAWLMLLPLAALGLLWPAERRQMLPVWLAGDRTTQGLTAVLVLVALGIYGAIDAFSTKYTTRSTQAELGRWLNRHYGTAAVFYGSPNVSSVAAYYAGAPLRELPSSLTTEELRSIFEQSPPSIVLVRAENNTLCELLTIRAEEWRLEEVDRRYFPKAYPNSTRLFVRSAGTALADGRNVEPQALR